MKKSVQFLSLVIVNIILVSGLLKADTQSNSIVICGKVFYTNTATPVSNSVVKLYKINDDLVSYKVLESARSNEKGEYSFTCTQLTPETKIRIGAYADDLLNHDRIEFTYGYVSTDEMVELGAYANDITMDRINPLSEIYSKTVPVDLAGAGVKNITLYIQPEVQTDEMDGGGIGTYPRTHIIKQNFPNPFNPTTNITYGISEQSFVSLKVYDMSGKMVSELVNETKDKGYYTVKFDGSHLASGFYIYILKAGEFTATKKMSLIK